MENNDFSFDVLKNSNYKFKNLFGEDFLKGKKFICNNKLDDNGIPVNKKKVMTSFSFSGDLKDIFSLNDKLFGV